MTISRDIPFLNDLMRLFREGDLSATDTCVSTRMVEQVQEIYARVFVADYVGVTELMTDDFEMEIMGPPEIPLTGCWRGKVAAASALQRNFGLLEHQIPELIGVTAHEDAVLVMGRESGRVIATQRPYHVHWVQWFTFRDLLLARMLEIFDSQEIVPAFRSPPSP